MATEMESFPHLGGHHDNDSRIARLTQWLLVVFAITIGLGLLGGLRAF